jgi:hypothetical protein
MPQGFRVVSKGGPAIATWKVSPCSTVSLFSNISRPARQISSERRGSAGTCCPRSIQRLFRVSGARDLARADIDGPPRIATTL